MLKRPVIAIDGPAASGKGTLSRKLANALNFAHLDTGAVYRLVAKHLLDRGYDPEDAGHAIEAALHIEQAFQLSMLMDEGLRNDRIGSATSKISAIPEVRRVLESLQRNFAAEPPGLFEGAVLDGRDIGTVICPDADVKFYVTASTEVRAERRFRELSAKGITTDFDAVLKDMQERDFRDMNRAVAPLKPAIDAMVIDTSELSPDEALKEAIHQTSLKLSMNS